MKTLKIICAAVAAAACAMVAACAVPEEDGQTEYGTLSIADTYAWIGYPPSEFNPVFGNPESAEPLSYEYDESKISVSAVNHTATAYQTGEVEVRAYSEHYETTFTVICEEVDTGDSAFYPRDEWTARAQGYRADWRDANNGKTTVFIGDSFFDSGYFWTDFYSDYNGKDALCWGIGSTTTYTWETLIMEHMSDISPKNIVMHCGTNSVYDILRDADQVTSSLERLFTIIHDRMPRTQLWYFTITHRIYTGAAERRPIVDQINARIIEWAKGKSWLTVLDSCSQMKFDMIKPDGIHPNENGYDLFNRMLAESGIVIEDE